MATHATAVAPTPTRGRTVVLRIGLGLAAVIGALDVITGVQSIAGSFFAPPVIGIVMVGLGVLTLVMVPMAWGGRRRPAWAAVAARVLSAATALPAFFAPDVPAAGVVAASAGILLAAAVAGLVAFGLAGRR